ncbi:MTQ2 [Hepatospora eriocheir]|uniref:MTQ2 n=1 Tax=Hepatospora eriocheir TaxID=1081669 RepID=A0A1X0QL28_9MICR|nr:MTQ2 [Hepatospora eriocheir]
MTDYYEPNEDSFTFYDVLKEENITNKVILDLGSSTGYLSKSCSKNNYIINSDINYKALLKNEFKDKINTDLLKSININKIDVIIFNIPYLPNYCKLDNVIDSSITHESNDINLKYLIGGDKKGDRILRVFIDQIKDYKNILYLLIIELNEPKKIIKKLESYGFKVELMKIRKIQGETIIILKCYK